MWWLIIIIAGLLVWAGDYFLGFLKKAPGGKLTPKGVRNSRKPRN